MQFLAIADLGYCETDMSLEWESDYPNSITTTPPGTLAALKVAVSVYHCCTKCPALPCPTWLHCLLTLLLCAVQFHNAWEGNWLSFCAAREVTNAMIADAQKGTMLVHNGDISYAQ